MAAKTLVDILNSSNPSTLADALRQVGLGNMLRQHSSVVLNKVAPVLDANQLATLGACLLPKDARACTILKAYARAGTAAKGPLTIDAPDTTPLTLHIAIAPNGDIVVLNADAWTDLHIQYEPLIGDVVELTGVPVIPGTGVCAIPANLTARGVIAILDANVTTGTTMGRKIVLTPAAGAPATTKVQLDLAKANAQFAVADAVSAVSLSLLVAPALDSNAQLETNASSLIG